MPGPPPSPGTDRNRGFALIIVLWTLVLIAFITAHVVATGRGEIRIAGNLVANAVTGAAADGAVFQAIFDMLDPDPGRHWPLDGTVHELAIGDCRVTVRVEDETARINPNLASPALLEALLQITGSDPASARRIADGIGEWVGTPGAARTQDAMQAKYAGAGLDYRPPGEPLETLDELNRVLGITPDVFAAIRPHLSLFATATPTLAHADPIVAATMAALAEPAADATRPTDILTVRIAAAARGPGGAHATQAVIVRVTPRSGSYAILSWNAID